MASNWFHSLQRVCEAVPKTKLDEQLESLSVGQRLLVLLLSGVTVLTIAPVITDGGGGLAVAVALAFGTLWAITALIARFNRT